MELKRSVGDGLRPYDREHLPRAVARALLRTERDLVKEFTGRVPAHLVHQYVDEALGTMDGVLIPEFLPALVCREVQRHASRYVKRNA